MSRHQGGNEPYEEPARHRRQRQIEAGVLRTENRGVEWRDIRRDGGALHDPNPQGRFSTKTKRKIARAQRLLPPDSPSVPVSHAVTKKSRSSGARPISGPPCGTKFPGGFARAVRGRSRRRSR